MAKSKKSPARKKPTPEQRIAVYVDSELVSYRLRQGKQISARIRGNYGVYRTLADIDKKTKTPVGSCACPSDWQLCKHVHALHETWVVNPESFFDLDQWLAELFDQPKSQVIDAIAKIVPKFPECLGEFGVCGSESNKEESGDEYYFE